MWPVSRTFGEKVRFQAEEAAGILNRKKYVFKIKTMFFNFVLNIIMKLTLDFED